MVATHWESVTYVLAERRRSYIEQRQRLVDAMRTINEVGDDMPDSTRTHVLAAALDELRRRDMCLGGVITELKKLETRRSIWLALLRSSRDRYDVACASILDAWEAWVFGDGYRPQSTKQRRRALGSASSSARKLADVMRRNPFLREIAVVDLLPTSTTQANFTDGMTEPALAAIEQLIAAIEARGVGRPVPASHAAAELAYELSYRLDAELGIRAHLAVARFTSAVTGTTINVVAVRRLWDRSLISN